MTSNKMIEILSKNAEWILGAALFTSFVAANLFASASAAVKVLGIGCIFTGATWFFRREITAGIESRPPTTFVRGWLAMLGGGVMVVLGVALIFYSLQVACIFGWIDGKACS